MRLLGEFICVGWSCSSSIFCMLTRAFHLIEIRMVILGDYSSLDNGNITIIEQSTVESGLGEGFTVNVGAAGGSTITRRVCLPGEGTYSFVIFDSYYNG
jgi:hypothetical protein